MIINILISVVFYFILMYLSVNLLGFFVRGFVAYPKIDELKEKSREFLKHEIKKSQRVDRWINVFALILIVAYLYLLFHFWNIGVVVVAIILMIARLPDLVWEIEHGRKIEGPKNALFYISAILTFGALPLLYYFLYHF